MLSRNEMWASQYKKVLSRARLYVLSVNPWHSHRRHTAIAGCSGLDLAFCSKFLRAKSMSICSVPAEISDAAVSTRISPRARWEAARPLLLAHQFYNLAKSASLLVTCGRTKKTLAPQRGQ